MEFLKGLLRFFGGIFQTVIIIAVFLLILYVFVIQPHEVSGSSMYPNFKDKEFVLSYLLDVRFNNLKRGDVVVFRSPTDEEKLFIKRIIGIEGDTIRLENGVVLLNGQILDESAYLSPDIRTDEQTFLKTGQEITIEPDKIFVMGDNRPLSFDSRGFGPLDKTRLIGRSMVRIWPMNQFMVIKNPYNRK